MEKWDVFKLADLLEKAGYENTLELIEDVLIPEAIKEGLSLRKAMEKYADGKQDQDTSYFQLHMALLQIGRYELDRLSINEVLKEKPY